MARANRVQVSVTYYQPCLDKEHDAYGLRGQYQTITGICWNVDAEVCRTITVDRMRLSLDDVIRIEAPGGIFKIDWEDPWQEETDG